ncbi:MAG: GlxA family transcriptional regulator [Porticoccaceae bacterium]
MLYEGDFTSNMGHMSESNIATPQLSVGIILLPYFTLSPFAAFVDTLRLAGDKDDLSQQVNCRWTIMSPSNDEVESSCGVKIKPWESLRDPSEFDYVVVVGGLLHRGPTVSQAVINYLQLASKKQVALVGLCTGTMALIRAGLMENRRCCVSWFHYKDFLAEKAAVTLVADQLYIDDGDRITCAGGTVTAELASSIVERHLGLASARKSLRILVVDQSRPANTPQPQPASAGYQVTNKWVKRALLLLEQNMSRPLSTQAIADRLSLSKRQIERLFIQETGDSVQKLYRKIRLGYGLWLLQNSDRSITDIAAECGFTDTAHFSRAFRAEFDKQPSQLRGKRL